MNAVYAIFRSGPSRKSLNRLKLNESGDDVVDDVPVDIGQAEIAALIAVGQLFVIDS